MLAQWLSVTLIAATFVGSLHGKEREASLEEGLELRRIAEYWKEQDYNATKMHIRDFLIKNPRSPFTDSLYAMLGDIDYRQKNYADALRSYEKLESKEFKQKSQFPHLHCLYLEGNDEGVIALAPKLLKHPQATRADVDATRLMLAEARYRKAYREETSAKKKELYREALSDYLPLEHTQYAEAILLPQAQIYAILEDFPKAASSYIRLAYKDNEKKEDYLFLAAAFQLHFDCEAAIATFGKICELNGKHAPKAAFNQLNLLFQEKRYRDFILAYEKSGKYISPESQPLIQYYLGKALVHIEDYGRAVGPLLQALVSKKLDRSQEKNALLATIACAKENRDEALFESSLAELQKSFPQDPGTADALLLHTQLCSEKKDWAAVRSNIATILEYAPEHRERKTLLYDNALAYVQEGRWQEGAESFELLLHSEADSEQRTNALRHYVQCRIQDASHSSPEAESVKKELLVCAIGNALSEAKVFSPPERQKMRLQLAKTQFDLKEYDEAIGTLSQYVKDYPNDATSANAYLMLALCYKHGSEDNIHFAINAERALALDSKLAQANELHITLYNTYLGLAAKALDEEKGELIDKAADHLYLVFDRVSDVKNKRWLAHYYYQQSQKKKCGALDKAAIVLERLLGIEYPGDSIAIDEQSMEKEAEVIRLAEIYAQTGRLKEKTQLLSLLTDQQKSHPELPWKFQRMALFELGKAHVENHEGKKGLKIFEELMSASPQTPSYFAVAAKAQWAKTRFATLSPIERKENATAIQEICDALKEVDLQRKLHSEPLHLEAALDYVEIKTALAPEEERDHRRKLLLDQMRENYTSLEDPALQQYLSVKEQFPEKERLYLQYMEFLSIEMDRLEARNATEREAIAKRLAHLYAEASHEALKDRIQEKML